MGYFFNDSGYLSEVLILTLVNNVFYFAMGWALCNEFGYTARHLGRLLERANPIKRTTSVYSKLTTDDPPLEDEVKIEGGDEPVDELAEIFNSGYPPKRKS